MQDLKTLPDGTLAIAALDGIRPLGEKIDAYLTEWRKLRAEANPTLNAMGDAYAKDSYLVNVETPRFGSGEAKATLRSSVRGDDVYVLVDVCNYSITYKVNGYENCKSPDDYFQDLKRAIAAAAGSAKRINVIMPYLYEGRQMERASHESLDCSNALQELEKMKVSYLITFDAHNDRVQNAVPLMDFLIFQPAYQFIKNLLRAYPGLGIGKDELMVISPDENGMRRAIYLANVLGVDMGTFYQRHDYSIDKGTSHPIVANEYLGSDVAGKNMIIIDDMISSGHSVLATARALKERGAAKVFICATFGMFTQGLRVFDEAYEQGLFDKMVTTNLTYQPPELLEKEYYISCDMSKYLALIIDTLNHDSPISSLLDPVDRINKVIKKHLNNEPI